ncbi:MAG: peptidoglycan DD-metalloendopeptidase family protein [Dehalococcoidia bacterium]
MHYSVGAGASHAGRTVRSLNLQTRQRLLMSAQGGVLRSSLWARHAILRRDRLLVLTGSAVVGVVLIAGGSRNTGQMPRNIGNSTLPVLQSALPTDQRTSFGMPAELQNLLPVPENSLAIAESPIAPAERAEQGAGLISAVMETRAVLADKLLQQQEAAQIAALPSRVSPSPQELAELTALVSQAQVDLRPSPVDTSSAVQAPVFSSRITASTPIPAPPPPIRVTVPPLPPTPAPTAVPVPSAQSAAVQVDDTALSKATQDVQNAQATLITALDAQNRPASLVPAPPVALSPSTAQQAQTVRPTATAAAAAASSITLAPTDASHSVSGIGSPAAAVGQAQSVATAPAASVTSPAALAPAQTQLQQAEGRRAALVAPPPANQVAAAQKAVADALASTPPMPSADQLKNAQAELVRAQAEFDAASQPPSDAEIAKAEDAVAVAGHQPATTGTPSGSGDPAASTPAWTPQLIDAQNALDRLLRGPEPQRLADAKLNLQQAKDSLTAVQSAGAVAANPESQAQVIAARKRLATLLAPPDRQKVADAQLAVDSARQQLDVLQSTPATIVAAKSLPAISVSVQKPKAIIAPAPVSSPAMSATAAAAPDAVSAGTAQGGLAPPIPQAPDTVSLAPALPTARSVLSVDEAKAGLDSAQSRLRQLIQGSANPSPAPADGSQVSAVAVGEPTLATQSPAPADGSQPPIVSSGDQTGAVQSPAATDGSQGAAASPLSSDERLSAVAPSSAPEVEVPASRGLSSPAPIAAAVPEGASTTAVTPAITTAEADVNQTMAISANTMMGLQVAMRATFVRDAVLQVLHLHPSAFRHTPSETSSTVLPSIAVPLRSFAWPVSGPITQPFGVPELGVGSPHTGIDIGVSLGSPVLSAAPGIVRFAGGDPHSGYGYSAIVDHGNGLSTLYGHFALPPFVLPGQFVAQGSLLGMSGSTGFSTGPHLHFEIRFNAVPVDPLPLLTGTRSG